MEVQRDNPLVTGGNCRQKKLEFHLLIGSPADISLCDQKKSDGRIGVRRPGGPTRKTGARVSHSKTLVLERYRS